MKRPSYFQQAVPSPRGSGLPLLAPPRLLFRPDPAAAAAFIETVDAVAPRGSHLAGQPLIRSTQAGRHAVASLKQRTITGPLAGSAGATVSRRPDVVVPDRSAPRPVPAAAPPLVAPVLAPPPSPATIATKLPPLRIGPPGQTEQFPRQVLSRTMETPRGPSSSTPREAPSLPIAPPRQRVAEAVATEATVAMREPQAPGHARAQSALPVITPPAQPAPVRQAPTRTPASPSFHIGTLEVNVLPPAPMAQPPAAARPQPRAAATRIPAGRLARGFGVFGLGQS